MEKPFRVSWKLPKLIEQAPLDLAELEVVLQGKVPELAAWTQGTPKTFDADTLGWLLWGLGKVTGREYALDDVLEFEILLIGA